MGYGITDLHLCRVFYTAYYISHLSCRELLAWNHIHLEHSYLVGCIFHSCVIELHFVAFADLSILYLEVCNNATERIEYRVEDECLQGLLRLSCGMWNALYYSLQYILHSLSGFSGSSENVFPVTSDKFNYLVFHLFRHSRRHVNLIDYRDYLEVVIDSHIQVTDSLRLNSLCGIYHE